MADSPLVYGTSIWVPEVTQGVPIIPATKRMLTLGLTPNPTITQNMWTPVGSQAPTVQILGKEQTDVALTGVMCFNTMPYLLSSLFLTVTPTTPASATNTRLWTFLPSNFSPDVFKTYTVEHGFLSNGQRFSFGSLLALTMANTETDSSLTGTMVGQALTDLITMNASPTDVAASPVIPKQVDVYLGSTFSVSEVQSLVATGASSGNFTLTYEGSTTSDLLFSSSAAQVQTALELLPTIGKNNVLCAGGPLPTTPVTITFQGMLAGIQHSLVVGANSVSVPLVGGSAVVTETTPGGMGKLLRCDRVQIAIPNNKLARRTLDANQASFSYFVQLAVPGTAEIILGYDSVSAGFMAQFRAGTTMYLEWLCRGPIIVGEPFTYPRWIRIRCPVRFTDSNRADQNAVWGITYPLAMIYDTTFGGYIEVQVQNNLASL